VARFGKVVGEAQYVHKSAISVLADVEKAKLLKCLDLIDATTLWNVVKFDLKEPNKVSLLEYSSFAEDAFPVLLNGTNIDLSSNAIKHRAYSLSNPPVLHRKELLLPPSDPNREKYVALTEELEELGAFINISELGTKQRWLKRLEELGIEIVDHEIRVFDQEADTENNALEVFRHRTALKRKKLSSCMGALVDSSLVTNKSKIFDYGCGRGDDVSILAQNNFENVSGWDPYFAKDNVIPKKSEFVSLSFVLNVIEDVDERHSVLKKAFKIASKALVFSVMLEHQNTLQFAYPFNDGYLTSINTFQKYYSAPEIEAVVKEQLNDTPIKLGPGIYIVFKDKSLEQEYLFKRQLGLLVETKTTVKDDAGDRFAEALVAKMVKTILGFGRVPKLTELKSKFQEEIAQARVSYNRLSRLALSQISISDLKHVREAFSAEMLIFLAINRFDGRVKYGDLPEKFQIDVRAHFGSLRNANEEAERLLFSLSDTDGLISAALDAERAGHGHLIGTKFRCHSKQCENLPKNLRLFYKIGERLHRSIADTDIIQLHLETKKMAFLIVNEFEKSSLPRIHSREIVNFATQDIVVVPHQEKEQVRILFLKSALMDAQDEHFEIQRAFDAEVLEKAGDLFSDNEPSFEEFAREIMSKKISIPNYS
jgi:DNA phosphorothioation-associated putative methyltransferase